MGRKAHIAMTCPQYGEMESTPRLQRDAVRAPHA
jgi:hypothetical protein